MGRSLRVLEASDSYQYEFVSHQLCNGENYLGDHLHQSLVETRTDLASLTSFVVQAPGKRSDGTWVFLIVPDIPSSCLRTEVKRNCPLYEGPSRAMEPSAIGVVPCSPNTSVFTGPRDNNILETKTPTPDYFVKHSHYVASLGNGPMVKSEIDWTIEARRAGPCRAAGVTPLIDQSANSTTPDDINDEDVSMGVEQGSTSISPDSGVARLNVRVTCEQVPVQNARVEIKVVAEKATGGHDHDSGAGGRPRGSLTWQGAETKLTDSKPSIQTTTDADGQVHFTFKPGKATSCPQSLMPNCSTIGIAGIYEITATSVRFPLQKDVTAVTAEVPGLTSLDPIPNLVDDAKSAGHKATDYATAPTAQKLAQFADDFNNAQIEHDGALAECRKVDPNVVKWAAPRPLWVIDISLPSGGLYDYGGTWGTPHQTHSVGDGVDFAINNANRASATSSTAWPLGGHRVPVCDGLTTDPQGWLMMTMWRLGEKYGHWDNSDRCSDYSKPQPHCPGDQLYHLHVNQ